MEEPGFHLRLLGGFALDRASGGAAPVLRQRRSEGVLAVLAVSADLGCSRDRLIAYFWPESPESKARHNLRDALYALRQTLGSDAVLNAGDGLRMNPGVIRADVQAFEEALQEGQLAKAVALHRGPFLDGFHVEGSHEFGLWVESERARLAQDRQQAVKQLAKRAEREERWDAAAEWWGRALAGDRFNSRLLVRRMVALTRAGDRANAVMEGEQHCRTLTSELGLDPDPALLEELERIREGAAGPAQFFTPPPAPETGSPTDPSARG